MVDLLPAGLKIPPLENGDRLNRYEFERRYQSHACVEKGRTG
jgi:hypothetical protein